MELITTLIKKRPEVGFSTTKFPFFVLDDHQCEDCGEYFVDLLNGEYVMYLGVCERCWEVNHS